MKGPWILFALLAASGSARAGGILLPGSGPASQQRAGAFVARADDPSAMANNPAGLARTRGTVIAIGLNLIDFDETFQRSGRYELSGQDGAGNYEGQDFPEISDSSRPSLGIGGFQAIPMVVVASDLGHPEWPVRFAVGLVAPQGFPARHFDEQVDVGTSDLAPGPQRYDIIEQDARIAMPSLAVSWAPLDRLAVGVRLGWGYATVHGKKAVWSVTNYEEWPGHDAVFTIDVKDRFIPGAGAGALWRAKPWLELGAAWSAPMNVEARGTGSSKLGGNIGGGISVETGPVPDEYAQCAPGGAVGACKACLGVDIAQTASAGARLILRDAAGNERGDLELDLAWENWSKASTTSIIVDAQVEVDGGTSIFPLNPTLNRHGFRDVWSLRLGGSWWVPVAGHRLELRAGAAHDTATAPVSWNRVDLDGKPRTTLAGGLALTAGRVRIEAGGGLVLEPDRTVGQCRPPDGPTITSPGCSGGVDLPFDERTSPDPGQPLMGPKNQLESPFNAGSYQSGYLLLSLGVTVQL